MKESVPKPTPETLSVNKELDQIITRLDRMEKKPCTTIQTPSVQLTFFNPPNLGIYPIPTYDKPGKKGASDVRQVQEGPGK